MTLVDKLIHSGYCLGFTAAILEKLTWPSKDLKEEILPLCMALYIESTFGYSYGDSRISLGKEEGKEVRVIKIEFPTKKIFGSKNLVEDPTDIPDSLACAICEAIDGRMTHLFKREHNRRSQDVEQRSAIPAAQIGFQVSMSSLPSSMLAPILLFLGNMPGLVSLELSEWGTHYSCSPFEPEEHSKEGFTDTEIPVLLQVLKKNAHLGHLSIDLGGMSEEGRTKFIEEWQKLWENREFNLPLLKLNDQKSSL